MVKRIEHYTVT